MFGVDYSSSSNSEGSEDIPLARLYEKLLSRNEAEEILPGMPQELKKKEKVRKRTKYKKSAKERQDEAKRKKLENYGARKVCKNCKRKCNLNFDKARRLELNRQYWNMGWQERQTYISSNATARCIRRRLGTDETNRQKCLAYYLKTETGHKIQVREPEKQKSAPTSKATTTSSANGDIRKYIASPVKGTHPTSPKKSPNKTKAVVSPNHDIRSYFINNSSSTTNGEKKNVETNNLNNSDSPEIVAVLNTGNVHGFKGLGTSSKVRKDLKTTDFNKSYKGSVGIKSNNSNTVVVTSKQNTGSKITEKQSDNVVPFSGPGRVLSSSGNTLDHNKVRDHWLKKYGNSNLSTKRQASDGIQEAPNKKRHSSVIEIVDDKEEEDLVICPVCDKKIKINVSSEHIGQCLDRQFCDSEFEDLEETCYVCNKKVLKSAYKHHVAHCFNTSFGDGGLENLVECPICSMYFDKCKIEEHVIACIDAASEENRDKSDSNVLTQCTVCSEFVKSEKLALHQEQCLHRMLDDIEERYDIPTSNELISCLVCHKKVLKSELNAHLDECMSGVFEQKISRDTTKNDEETSCSKDHHSNENKYNCPFCMDLYSELDMSGHLDKCLKSSEQENNDRSILIDSFNSDDF